RCGKTTDPAGHLFQCLVTGQVDLDGRDGDETGAYRVEIGPRTGILLAPGRADPVHQVATRIFLRAAAFGTVAVAQAGYLEAVDLCPRQVRHVDVEDGVGRQRVGTQARNDLHRRA